MSEKTKMKYRAGLAAILGCVGILAGGIIAWRTGQPILDLDLLSIGAGILLGAGIVSGALKE